MNADLVGALEQVRKVLVYGIQKGYEHTGQLTDEDVELALTQSTQ